MQVHPLKYHIDGDVVTFWLRTHHSRCCVDQCVRRGHDLDVRVNVFDDPDWKKEWPLYSGFHSYYNTTVFKYKDKLLNIGSNSIRTKHYMLKISP